MLNIKVKILEPQEDYMGLVYAKLILSKPVIPLEA